MRRYNSLSEFIDSIKHEPDDCDLSDAELFTADVLADQPLNFSGDDPCADRGADGVLRWQARRWH